MEERRLHPRALVLWNTVVKITPQRQKGNDNFSVIAVLRDISLEKDYCNGFGFECKTKDAGKIQHEEKAMICIMAEIDKDVCEIAFPVVLIKARGDNSLGARMDKAYEKRMEKHPFLESWIKELHKEKKIILPEQINKILDYINRKEFHPELISFVAKNIAKKLADDKIPSSNFSSGEARIMRFLKADYDFKAGVLRKEFLKTCLKKKSSLDLDSKDKWKGILQELAEKKATAIMGKRRFKEWL